MDGGTSILKKKKSTLTLIDSASASASMINCSLSGEREKEGVTYALRYPIR